MTALKCNAEWADEPACPRPGVYRVEFAGCRATVCARHSRCFGHAVCIECAADIRAASRSCWYADDADIVLASISGVAR